MIPRMNRFVMLAAMLAAMVASGGDVVTAEEKPPAVAPPAPASPAAPATKPAEISFFDGSGWTPLARHDIYVKVSRATLAGADIDTVNATLDGPETYVVLGGATSDVLLSTPMPRFRIASDRVGVFRIRLARFETVDQKRRTTIERIKSGVFFTKGIDLELMEVDEGLWEVTPTKSLQPGEYAFAASDSEAVADFTIVEKR
jgi:hypothetical protein